MHRNRLPNRRLCETINFQHGDQTYTLGIGVVEGKQVEIFLNNSHLGSLLDSVARDAAIAVSIAMQYGAPVGVLATAMTRNVNGSPSSPIGQALDIIETQQK